MKKLLKSITFSLVLLLTFSSFQLESLAITDVENPNDLIESDSATDVENSSDLVEFAASARSCDGTFYADDSESFVVIQTNKTSVNRTIQFTFKFSTIAYEQYSPKAEVYASALWVNDVHANSPYAKHTDLPNYFYHGSMKAYQVVGQNRYFKKGDVIKSHWRGGNATDSKIHTSVNFECTVG